MDTQPSYEATIESRFPSPFGTLGDLYYFARIHGRKILSRDIVRKIDKEAIAINAQRNKIISHYEMHGNLKNSGLYGISQDGLSVLEILLKKPVLYKHSI